MAHIARKGEARENIKMKQKKVKIVFVCVENARRSQMAQGFAESLGQGKVEIYSAGSRPSSQIDPLVIDVMKQKRIALSGKRPKGLNDLPPVEMDYLVTMGCEETCPAVLSKRVIEWDIPDPKGKPIDVYRRIRDFIEERIKALLKDVG